MCSRLHRQDPPAQVEHARLPERTASTPGAILAYSSVCLHSCTANTPPRSPAALRCHAPRALTCPLLVRSVPQAFSRGRSELSLRSPDPTRVEGRLLLAAGRPGRPVAVECAAVAAARAELSGACARDCTHHGSVATVPGPVRVMATSYAEAARSVLIGHADVRMMPCGAARAAVAVDDAARATIDRRLAWPGRCRCRWACRTEVLVLVRTEISG